jgi:hypothetical protein
MAFDKMVGAQVTFHAFELGVDLGQRVAEVLRRFIPLIQIPGHFLLACHIHYCRGLRRWAFRCDRFRWPVRP